MAAAFQERDAIIQAAREKVAKWKQQGAYLFLQSGLTVNIILKAQADLCFRPEVSALFPSGFP